MMTIDPVDDCTCWYTNEYTQTTGATPWKTRIGIFKFPSCVMQWGSVYSGTGAALAAPGIYFDGANNTQVFFGCNSGIEQGYYNSGARLWSRNAGAAIGDRGPIIPINGTNYVAVTSQDGFVTVLTATTGSVLWQRDLSAGGSAPRLVASVSYQANVGPSNHGLIFVGTYYNTAPASSIFYALDATNGSTVWTFNCTSGGCTGGLGLITVTPTIDLSNNRVFFAAKNVTGGGGGGVFALNSLTGAFVWARTNLGSANTGHPTLSDDRNTLYLALGTGQTLYALNTNDGTNRVGWTAFAPGGSFQGAPWMDSGALYVSAGNTVYALNANTGAQTWSAAVPGAGTPVVLALVGDLSLYVGSSDGGFYRLRLADGGLMRKLALSPAAVSDPAYDYLHHLFYLTTNGILYAIQDNY